MTAESLYWITRLDQIKSFVEGFGILTTILTVILGVIGCIFFGVYLNTYGDDKEFAKAIWKSSLWISVCPLVLSIVLSIAYIFIPSTKEYFVIKALPIICSDINIDKTKQLIPEALDATSEWIKSLNKEKK